jgi:hypothetical protein
MAALDPPAHELIGPFVDFEYQVRDAQAAGAMHG